MEPISHLHRYRRRPTFTRMRTDSSTYLSTARLHLLRHLPDSHRLMYRITRDGGLKSPEELPPDIPRIPFTEEELAQIKMRRKHTPDPEDVRYQLQDSKLVQMWNADYDCEEQWKEYDEAKSAMEFKKEVAGLPDSKFDADEVVRERRRRRAVEVEDIVSVKRSVVDDRFVKEKHMEEGEIEEETEYLGEVEEDEDEDGGEEIESESLRTLKKTNDRLTAANDAMRVAVGGSADNVLPASPVSEGSESSGDESDDSMKAEYEFELSDNEEYSERSKWADKNPRMFSPDDMEFMRRVIEETDDSSEEKEESQPDGDVG